MDANPEKVIKGGGKSVVITDVTIFNLICLALNFLMAMYLMTTITDLIKYSMLDQLKDTTYKWLSRKLSNHNATEQLKEIRAIEGESKKIAQFSPWTIMLILTNLI